MKRCLLLLGLLPVLLGLPACTQSWEARFAREYDWNKLCGVTPIHKIKVAFPTWLAPADRPRVLVAVDSYATDFLNANEWAKKNFHIASYTVWIHDAIGGFVAGSRDWSAWARGWAIGKYVIVAWGYDVDATGRPVDISTKDILPALTHEWVHVLLQERYACADPGHFLYYPTAEVQTMIIQPRLMALARQPISLTKETIAAAHRYRYFPWLIPGESE